jgi:hypothetical protein
MKKLMVTVCLALFAGAPLFAAEPPGKTTQVLETLLVAIQSGDYERFMAPANATFRSGITKDKFVAISQQLAPRLKKGYETIYLGKLDQFSYDVYLWKLRFSDGGDDHLVKLSTKNGKVGGFWIQ